jgi:hypothetical protein
MAISSAQFKLRYPSWFQRNERLSYSPVRRRRPAPTPPTHYCLLRISFLLLEGFGASLSEIGEVNQAHGLGAEQVFRGFGL